MSTDADQAELPIWKPPLRYPFKLRVNDYVRIEGKLGRVIRVTESAAVVLVNQPPREFTTLFDKRVRFRPSPKTIRIAANSEIEILNRRVGQTRRCGHRERRRR